MCINMFHMESNPNKLESDFSSDSPLVFHTILIIRFNILLYLHHQLQLNETLMSGVKIKQKKKIKTTRKMNKKAKQNIH